MLNRNKYWRTLLGTDAEVLVGKALEYSAKADITAFTNTAAEGEIGMFNANTGALIAGTAAAAAGTEMYFALKRNGLVERTETFSIPPYKATTAAYAAATTQASKVTFTGTPVAGEYYAVKVIETTQGYQQFPSWEYGVVAKSGDTVTTIMAAIAALVNSATNPTNVNTDPIVTATAAAGVLTLTGKVAGTSFNLASSAQALTTLASTVAYTGSGTTRPSYGTGTYDQIEALETIIGDIRKGVTTQYPNLYSPADFATPTKFSDPANQYSLYLLKGVRNEKSPAVEQHHYYHTILVAVPSNGAANPDGEIKTILGL